MRLPSLDPPPKGDTNRGPTRDHAPVGPGAPDSVQLTRDLGFWDITLIGVGAMVGAGIFVLVGSAAGRAGPALVLAFVANGVVALLTSLVYAELGSAIPSAGGSYVFIKQALPPFFSFLAGWMAWFAAAVAGSLYALGFGSFTVELVRVGGLDLGQLPLFRTLPGHAPAVALGILIALLFFYINFRGASETGTAGAIVTVAKVAAIAIFVAGGIWVLIGSPERFSAFQPFAPNGLTGVFLAMGITYVAFEGFEVIVQAGEEVKDPKRTVPKAVLTAMVIVIPLYLLVSITLLGAIDPPDGASTTWQWLGQVKELGLARAASQVLPYGSLVILIGGLLSTMSALNATTFASTRVSFAMGRDRFLPSMFGRIHQRNRTPHVALAFTGSLILVMLVTLPLESVAASASFMFLLLFMMVNVSSVMIRKRFGNKLAYGYLTPFFPAVPIAAVVIQIVLAAFMLQFGVEVLATVAIWIGLGTVLYFTYARRHERAKIPTPVVVEERHVLERTYAHPPVVVPTARPQGAKVLAQTAAAIARNLDRHVLVLHVVTVPEQLPLSAGNDLVAEARDEVQPMMDLVRSEGVQAELLIRLAHDAAVAITRTVNEARAQFCVLGWKTQTRGGNRVLGSNLDEVLRNTNCNFIVMQQLPDRIDKILVPVSNPLQAQLAFVIAFGVAHSRGSTAIDLVRVFDEHLAEGAREELLAELAQAVAEASGIRLDLRKETTDVDGVRVRFRAERAHAALRHLADLTAEYDLMVLGAGPGGIMGRDVMGHFTRVLAEESRCPVIAVKRRTGALHFQLQSFFQFFRDEEEATLRELGPRGRPPSSHPGQ